MAVYYNVKAELFSDDNCQNLISVSINCRLYNFSTDCVVLESGMSSKNTILNGPYSDADCTIPISSSSSSSSSRSSSSSSSSGISSSSSRSSSSSSSASTVICQCCIKRTAYDLCGGSGWNYIPVTVHIDVNASCTFPVNGWEGKGYYPLQNLCANTYNQSFTAISYDGDCTGPCYNQDNWPAIQDDFSGAGICTECVISSSSSSSSSRSSSSGSSSSSSSSSSSYSGTMCPCTGWDAFQYNCNGSDNWIEDNPTVYNFQYA